MSREKIKKISNKYWVHNNPKTLLGDTVTEWETVKGRRVTVKGFEEFDLFAHRDRIGDWKISEGITGMAIVKGEFTRKEAKDLLELIITMDNDMAETLSLKDAIARIYRGIDLGIEQGGISPRYTNSHSRTA